MWSLSKTGQWSQTYVWIISCMRPANEGRRYIVTPSPIRWAHTQNAPCRRLDMERSLCSEIAKTLHWRHNGHDSVSNHQPHDCLLNRLFRRRSKQISKLRVTGLCAGNSPETGEFPAQMASNAENVSIWWRHHEFLEDKQVGIIQWKAYF